jgi:PH/SEC7 domain-containing protein
MISRVYHTTRWPCFWVDREFLLASNFTDIRRNVNHIALRYYMQYFDSTGQNLVDAFRDLCKKLHLKAESQEIDRIIEAFSARYFECNPTTVFGTAGVVHTVTGAMLMLNTDLHIADLSKHMSRNDFVRNSMRAVQESMPASGTDSTPDLVRDDSGSISTAHGSVGSVPGSIKERRPPNAPPGNRSASAPVIGQNGTAKNRDSCATVGSFSYGRVWEQEAETALRVSLALRANANCRTFMPTSRQIGSFYLSAAFPETSRPIRNANPSCRCLAFQIAVAPCARPLDRGSML